MNELLMSGVIAEMQGTPYVTYIFNDNSKFQMTGLKVLKSQENSVFLKCEKVLYNGKIKLIYFNSGEKSLETILPSLDGNNFLVLLSNLLNAVIEIKNNGFLSCYNLDLSCDKIYIDLNTLSVKLVYIPANSPVMDNLMFENELKRFLLNVVNSSPALQVPGVIKVCQELSNINRSIEDICSYISGEYRRVEVSSNNANNANNVNNVNKQMVIYAVNAPTNLEIVVNKKEFVLGRNVTNADGVVDYNKAIGRAHCKVINNNNIFYVADLQSANGTYINGVKLTPLQPKEVKDGDMLRMANSDFRIQIRGE